MPAIDKAEEAYAAVGDDAFILTDKKPADRDPERVKKVVDQVKAARTLTQKALEKLGDKAIEDDSLKSAHSGGREYLQAIDEMLAKFEQLLEQQASWDKESRWAEAKRGDSSLAPADRRAKAQAIMHDSRTKIETVLNDQQKQQFEQQMAQRRARRHQRDTNSQPGI